MMDGRPKIKVFSLMTSTKRGKGSHEILGNFTDVIG